MKITFTLAFVIPTVLMSIGCAPTPQPRYSMTDLIESVQEERWREAFLAYAELHNTAPHSELVDARVIVKSYPEIKMAGVEIFTDDNLREWVADTHTVGERLWVQSDAFCTIASDDECKQARASLAQAETLVPAIKPALNLLESAYAGLNLTEKGQLEARYEIYLHNENNVGPLIERQQLNVSTPANTAGSQVGSAVASAIYIDNSFSSGTYNPWTDLAWGVAGGVVGALADNPAEDRYVVRYTIRNESGELRSTDVLQSSPIGAPLGSCFSVSQNRKVKGDVCGMTARTIKESYLQ